MDKSIRLNLGIVLNNNNHTLITKIRKDRFGWVRDGVWNEAGTQIKFFAKQQQGTYTYGFYRYTYRNPEDILLNFTPENMLFYYGALDTTFDEYLAGKGVTYLTKIKWDPKMAPLTIYQGGFLSENGGYAVSEHGILYEPATRVKHWTTTGFGSIAKFCNELNKFLEQNEFNKLINNEGSYWEDAFYNPNDFDGLNE